jgi:Cu2+-exporting ATPase
VTGVAVLIITCPCALGLAVPVAQVVASGSLMRAGIMVKDGSALERLAPIGRALLDKTGTLTMGRPLPDHAALLALDADEAAVATALASHSRHPLSRALSAALAERPIAPATLSEIGERAGEGVFARWNGIRVSLSRPQGGGSALAAALSIEGRPVRLIAFSDRLRPDTRAALAQLRQLGVECSILSGDRPEAVAEIARETGLTAHANARPADKQALVARLRAKGHDVLVAGDGLNDGPALAAASASMAPGSASDVGLQAADLVFVQDSLLSLPRALRAARRTMAVVRQNFALAIAYNVLAVPLAMAGVVTPLIAAVAMSTSSLIVIANSLRLARAAQ